MSGHYLLIGGNGQVGIGISEALKANRLPFSAPSSKELDALNTSSLFKYFKLMRPDTVILCAGIVGGIEFNRNNQLSQYYANLNINQNVFEISDYFKVKNLCMISSSCVYPVTGVRPLKEEQIFDGLPEETNEGYAIAKSSSMRLLKLYKSTNNYNWYTVVPTNIYGAEKEFNKNSHLIPSLIKKLHLAKENSMESVSFWGTGKPKRQFLHTLDLGVAIMEISQKQNIPDLINISTNETHTISDVVNLTAKIVGFSGRVEFDETYSDGNPDKTLDISVMNSFLSWRPKIKLREGITLVYKNFLDQLGL